MHADSALPPLPKAPSKGPQIIHADSDIVILDKPHWLLSVPGRMPENKDSVISRLEQDFGEVFVVHRLDCATRGLMMVARNKRSQSHLSKQFQQRRVSKVYLAEVVGHPAESFGEINLPLATDWPNRPKQKVDLSQGKASKTGWRVIAAKKHTSVLALIPITGRSHQLRVHTMSIGHPILGDRLYAPIEWVRNHPTLRLEAVGLRFAHPTSGVSCDFELNSDIKLHDL